MPEVEPHTPWPPGRLNFPCGLRPEWGGRDTVSHAGRAMGARMLPGGQQPGRNRLGAGRVSRPVNRDRHGQPLTPFGLWLAAVCAASEWTRCRPGKATGPAPTKSRSARPLRGHPDRSSGTLWRSGLRRLNRPIRSAESGGVTRPVTADAPVTSAPRVPPQTANRATDAPSDRRPPHHPAQRERRRRRPPRHGHRASGGSLAASCVGT